MVINKNISAYLFYVISGVCLLVVFFALFYTYVLRLKIETAVVSAKIEAMAPPLGGYITDVLVSQGQTVKKGDLLLKIENIPLEKKLQLARVQVDEAKLDIDYYKQLLANESQRLKIYKKIGRHRVDSAESMVNISKQNVMTAQQDLDRITELHTKHFVSNAILEKKQAKYINAQEHLNHVTAQKNLERHSLKAVEDGMYFTGSKTEGIGQDLTAMITAAEKRELLNESRVRIYETLIKRLSLMAPFDGKVTQILKSVGNTTDSVNPLIFIEKTGENKSIIAWLTQDEVIHIGASGRVKIYIPSSGKTYHGHITEINRTEGFIDEVKAQYRWRDFQIDRSAMVTIAIQKNDQHAFDSQAFPGMPAVVYFSKKMI